MIALLPASPSSDQDSQGRSDASSSSASSGSQQWCGHRPSSPSPLSPHKIRTPRQVPASAGRRRTKTPLSRMVLEKAVRQKGKDMATAQEMARLNGSVLGDGAQKANATRPPPKSLTRPATLKSSVARTPSLGSAVTQGRTLKSSANLPVSQSTGIARKSQGAPNWADGVGPRSEALKSRVWR